MLERVNIFTSVSTVSRKMYILGIKSIVKKNFPKKKSILFDKEKKLIKNKIKLIEINKLNQVWTTDITYIKTINDGFYYLISFIDLFSRKIVAWSLESRQTTKEVIKVLKLAIKDRKPSAGLIIHSDKGSQMRSKEYRAFLDYNNFIYSYTSLNHSCDENAHQESFHAQLKKESLYNITIYNYHDAFKVIFDYIQGFYNPIRIHSSLGYLSPLEFEKSFINNISSNSSLFSP